MPISYYLKGTSMIGLSGPHATEAEAWFVLFKRPSTLDERKAMKEEGWSVRPGLIDHKTCGNGMCQHVPERAQSVSE